MNRHLSRRLALTLHLAVTLLAFSVVARGDGSLAFLSGTTTTVEAGGAFSWMEMARDWDKNTVPPGVITVMAMPPPPNDYTFAVPNINYDGGLFQRMKLTTSRTASSLILRFEIPDNTDKQPGGAALVKGDQIIVHLDPNNSGHAAVPSTTLSSGALCNVSTDYRFEINIKNSTLDAAASGYRIPSSPNTWDVINSPAVPMGCTAPTISPVTALVGIAGYDVTLTIPLNFIGGPAGPVGLAIAYLNDIGHAHVTPGGVGTTWEMLGTAFPSTMGFSTVVDDPGMFLTTANSTISISGAWPNPSQWGTGYFAAVPGDVTFTHSPFYYSQSIKVGKCNTSNWLQIDPAANSNQSGLTNWYEYFSTTPCHMRVWLQVNKTPAAGTVKRRFLLLWAAPSVSPNVWSVISLTNPVGVTTSGETFNVLWTSVPPGSFNSGHPCVRAYVLPEVLNQSYMGTPIDETFIKNITTYAQLNQMEAAYSLNAGSTDFHTAQMNFTNLSGTSCPTGESCLHASLDGGDGPADTASIGSSNDNGSVRFLKASFGSAEPVANLATAEPVVAQTKTGGHGGKDGVIRIYVEGYGVDSGATEKDYSFTQTLGGIGYAITNDDLVKKQELVLTFDVANPPLLRRDLTQNPPTELKSPPRDVFLNVKILTTSGVPMPTYTVKIDRTHLNPGESTKGTVIIRPKTGPPDVEDPDFKRWGFSLHGGLSIPHGNLSNVHGPGPNIGVDLEYRFNRRFSLETIYTFNRFNGDSITTPFGTFDVDALNLHVLSLNGKVYGTTSSVRPFFNFGGGVYGFTPGATVRGGMNVGGGFQFDVTPTVAFDAMYNFHNVFGSGSSLQYSTTQAGVRWRF